VFGDCLSAAPRQITDQLDHLVSAIVQTARFYPNGTLLPLTGREALCQDGPRAIRENFFLLSWLAEPGWSL
jgi:hypothetical protein